MLAIHAPAQRRAGALAALTIVALLILSACGPAARTPVARTSAVQAALPAPTACAACWRPPLQTSWQWQLDAPVDQSPDVAMYDIDLFDNSADVVRSLHASGRKVICYINAGAWENWRPDAGQYPSALLGASNTWPGERWLDIRQLPPLLPILQARTHLCQAKGFDGVEFDEVDGYANTTGFPLTAQDQLRFNVALANMAHAAHLSVALKNDLDQIAQLFPYFDWALDEQCFQYSECAALLPFIHAGKAVMEVEYTLAPAQFCPQANAMNFNALKKNLSLDATRAACR
jgi:hypothetical protein